jgi:glycosyltransferase involved in cell wall biosynthesis
MQDPLVTVVIPTYNSARFLRDALASVERQTYSSVEVVVVDGPSTDATLDIVRGFTQSRYLRQSGAGMWNALNEGIKAAQGELIAFLSDDDWWTDDKLRLQVEALTQHPEAEYVIGRVKLVHVEADPLPTSFRGELLEGEHVAHFPELWLARRRLFDRLGNFDERLQIGADIDWLARAKDAQIPFVVVPHLLLYKRIHADNLSSRPASGPLFNRELLQILRRKIARRRRLDGE